jgi:neutral ceramidase
MQGDCGDVTPNNFLTLNRELKGEDWARKVGGSVGAEAVKVLLAVARGSDVILDVRQKTWLLNRRVPSPEHVAESQSVLARGKQGQNRVDWMYAKEVLLADYLAKHTPKVEVEVEAVKIGPVVLVSNPAELFVEYGLQLKKESGFAFTFPVELANGGVGYVPTEEAFSSSGGGYETRLTSYSNLDPSAGRQFTDAGIALAREMTPGEIPKFPTLDKPGPAARAGAVGPQTN